MNRRPRPKNEVLFGAHYDDDWISPSVAINISPAAERRTIRIFIWNPYFNTQFMRNRLSVVIDGHKVFHDLIFAGSALRLEHEMRARDELLIEIESEAELGYDPLDSRERGVIVRLRQQVDREDMTPRSASPRA